ncbi:hypothetical protein Y032_0531g3029 [Ancylostoma ceylanicum]|uniref:Uncharacterized protein n=1 Tax=Ancylostoma ceylanicum TaxID=53326 RepID=A0A016WTU8_9BILA|nr:hypothetical protein Y032_0531g3029 [Ancylostoma ceylanicum]
MKNDAGGAETIPSLDPLNSLTAQSTAGTKLHETPVLAGTMEPLPSLTDSTVTEACKYLRRKETFLPYTFVSGSFADSDATLENVLRSQSETREMLEKAIVSLDSMNKERTEMAAKLATVADLEVEMQKLKGRITELEKENASLKQHEAGREETQLSQKKVQEEDRGAEHSLLKKNVAELQQQLYDRGLEVDARTKALIEATNELETAYRKIADLTESRDSAVFDRIKLSDKLDETYALLVAERERVSITEDQLRSFQSDGNSLNFSMVNEEAVLREMRQKADYATVLESELEKTRKELGDLANACERKDVELRDQEEIINVLKEEDMEGRRIIAEKDRKINELEQMVRNMRLDRAEVNNC